ncbi:hypothetical protein QBC32DRAFT_345334 [Pseudoneurospora amorphoporcata]|uniref:Uncharacterized protein n=1 Tax=Pseudoneurospora amorphoporcata TaxID=241081 RepID=A0AAN6SEN9_9PEZI|nr:hypothetical protein QBC32DRAFT_345334 [Pseudoneurospora amorphoporcata]
MTTPSPHHLPLPVLTNYIFPCLVIFSIPILLHLSSLVSCVCNCTLARDSTICYHTKRNLLLLSYYTMRHFRLVSFHISNRGLDVLRPPCD